MADGEEKGKMVEMEEPPPEPELGYRLGENVTVYLQELIMPARQVSDGLFRLTCCLCNWQYTGMIQVAEMYGQFHVDVVHQREHGALKKAFRQVKEEYRKRAAQSEEDKKKAAEEMKRAKKEMLEKMEAEDGK